MNTNFLRYLRILAVALAAAAALSAFASDAEAQADSIAATVDSPVVAPMAKEVTARDFVTKVYGILDPSLSEAETCETARRIHGLQPKADEMGLWLEKADGYQLNYYGMQPECSAMAHFENDAVEDFAFFFLFPFDEGERDSANARQAEFCGNLLQEMQDIGLVMNLYSDPVALFNAKGTYADNYVEVRLLEEQGTGVQGQGTRDKGQDGRFVLLLRVEPNAVSLADNLPAE